MESHEQEIEDLVEQLTNDKSRQQLALRDKLVIRRQQKMNELRRKQELELTKEMLEQKKEVDEIGLKKVSSIESHCVYLSYR